MLSFVRALSLLTRLRWRWADVWRRDLAESGPLERAGLTIVRALVLIARGVSEHALATRAAALTFTTIFSLVPTLAVAFAMFKAFGGLEDATDVLLPKILDYLAVGVREQAAVGIRDFLGNIHSGAIGAVGFLFMVMAVISLIGGMESAFNEIWGARRSRSYLQQLTTYWTIVTIAPTLLLIGVSLPSMLRRFLPLRWVLEHTGTGDVFFGWLLPVAFVCGAFTLLYAFITHAHVPLFAAAIGGVVGGVSWFAAAHAYAWYAQNSAYYTTVYGSLAAVPIFLFWVYVSWSIVLLGAETAFASQHLRIAREQILVPELGTRGRELLALRVVEETCRRFLRGAGAPSSDDVAEALGASARLVNQVVPDLVEVGALVSLSDGDRPRLLPARDPADLTPSEVVRRLRARGPDDAWTEDDATLALRRRYDTAEDAAAAAWRGVSFADVVRRARDRDETAAAS